MSKNKIETLPVTQAQMTETNIDYSVKISKQVVKKQLDAENAALSVEFEKTSNQMHKTLRGPEFCRMLEDSTKNILNAHGGLTGLREGLNLCLDENLQYQSNASIFEGDDTTAILELIRGDSRVGNKYDFIEKVIQDQKVMVEVTSCIAAGGNDHYCADQLKMLIEVTLDEEWINVLLEVRKLRKLRDETLTKMNLNYEKVNSLDTLMDEMEAQLLVNKLQESEEGKQVLSVTSAMVEKLLGKQPPMLAQLTTK